MVERDRKMKTKGLRALYSEPDEEVSNDVMLYRAARRSSAVGVLCRVLSYSLYHLLKTCHRFVYIQPKRL